MDASTMLGQALELMGIGVGSVFLVLGAFFGLVCLMKKVFPPKQEE